MSMVTRMDKADFMDKMEQHASNEFICRFCDIDRAEFNRLVELDDWLMLVSDTYDQMSNDKLIEFEKELDGYYYQEYDGK